jgi:hypothetical protein
MRVRVEELADDLLREDRIMKIGESRCPRGSHPVRTGPTKTR